MWAMAILYHQLSESLAASRQAGDVFESQAWQNTHGA
jgi:hypothetical protein